MTGDRASAGRRRFFAISLAVPTLGSALGIDGGAIFQIVAVEDLRLDPRVIGVAFGMGVLSVPVQLLAARLPLWRARRNLQLFLAAAAVACWGLAALVAVDAAGGGLALVALGVTVMAEIGLSVLYAPAFQPLVNFALEPRERQSLNSRGRAAGGLVVAATVVAFGSAGAGLRVALLVVVGAASLVLAAAARHLPAPARPVGPDLDAPLAAGRPPVPRAIKLVYLAFWFSGLAATWPLFLVYTEEVLWPTANLGVLGALQLGGSLLVAAAWRTTASDLGGVAFRASTVLVAATAALALVPSPVAGRGWEAVTVAALTTAAAAKGVILMALLERAHQVVDHATSVRALTLLDVVASTSLQLGLLAGGFLVSASVGRDGWPVDPYRLWLLVGTAALTGALAAIARTGKDAPP